MLAPWIIKHFPPHKIYVEPYMGAASVLMRKPRAQAEVINDLDGEIVNVFRVLRDPVAAEHLVRLLELTPWARREFFATYDEPVADSIEQARRTIVRTFMAFGTTSRRRNRTGFRGKCYLEHRTGPADWVNYPAAVKTFVARLRGVCIEEMDALYVIRQQDTEETLFYVDPPYPLDTRTSVQWPSRNERAYIHDLSDDEHRELAGVLRGVKGMVVLSGYPCELYDLELYPDWYRVTRGALADGARKRTEVVWLNHAAAEHLTLTLDLGVR